jgi:hypothetical protein
MNSLSWLLYLGEVVGGLKPLFGFTAFGMAFAVGGFALFNGIEGSQEKAASIVRRYAWLPLFLALIATCIPSTKTIYLIAASEAGEAVVTNPDAIEMMGDLKAIIKKRLKEELGED